MIGKIGEGISMEMTLEPAFHKIVTIIIWMIVSTVYVRHYLKYLTCNISFISSNNI